MRKFLVWFGAFAAVLTILAIGLFGYLAYREFKLNKESQQYADSAIVAITTHWSSDELVSRASPELLEATSRQQVQSLFKWFATIGNLIKYTGSKGGATFYAFTNGTTITAAYVCSGKYDNGDATINLSLSKRHGIWTVSGFHVDSTALRPKAAQKA